MAFRWSRGFARGNALRTLGTAWLHLVTVQFGLGLFTVITDRAADIATAHVAVGSMTLAVGCWFAWAVRVQESGQLSGGDAIVDSGLPKTVPAR